MNSLRVVIAVKLNASPRGRVGVRMNRSARGRSVERFEWSNGLDSVPYIRTYLFLLLQLVVILIDNCVNNMFL